MEALAQKAERGEVTPTQATPFFVDKLTQLSLYLQRLLEISETPIKRFIVARDQAYFKIAFFSGDLGQIKVPEILRFPNDHGFLIMDHVGWVRRHTALYYMQLAKVLNPEGASARLATSGATDVINPWQDINELKRFVSAFPTNSSPKRAMLD